MLEAFDVDPAAEAVYLAMLERPHAKAAELAGHLGLPEAAVRSALEMLAQLALLRPSWEDPLQLRPVSPEVGLEALLARQQAELLERQQQLDRGRAALAVLVADHAGRRRYEQADTERLEGLDAVRERLESLTASTRFELVAFQTGGAQSDAARQASRPLDEVLLERGVAMRTVLLDAARNDAGTVGYAKWLTERGGRVRTAPTLPLRMIVVDRETAIVPIDPEISRAGAVVLHGGGAVTAILALFDHVWGTATPLGAAPARDADGVSAHERTVLQLMATGIGDDAIARRLALSDRTVRRTIADLMDRLDSHSRFQLGVQASLRGWLDEPGSTRPDPSPAATRVPRLTRPRPRTAPEPATEPAASSVGGPSSTPS